MFFILPSVSFAQAQTFYSNGSYTVPPGVTSIQVEAWGGGAGGDSGFRIAGVAWGGGGGGYGREVLTVSSGETYYFTIGAGGVRWFWKWF